MKSPNTNDDALWKRRFRQPRIIKSDVAAANPNRGLVCSNKSGKYQLYAWDVPAGQLQQLTDKEAGVMFGEIDPQGAYVYYLDDQKGDELGHIVRVPFAGGEPQDLTSDFPPYSDRGMAIDYENQHLVLCLTNENGFHLYGLDLEDNGDTISTLRLLQQTEAFAVMPSINRDGDLVVWHLSQAQKLKYKLSVISWETGEVVAELSDGLDHSLLVIRFSPLLNDARILGKSNRSGYERPFIWNPLTNERVDLPFPKFEGDMVPLDWSGNGRLLLLSHVFQAQQQLYLYDFAQQNLIRLNHPQGVFDSEAGSYFSPDGSIYCGWQDATHPLCLIELDGQTGQKRGTLLAAGDSLPGQSWESITFPSTNERSIQAWMALPGPPEEGPYPTILHMVGGPGGVMRASYSANAQMWLDHGFAFVSVNYRGCSTFGQEFKDE
ncbi:MAG: hypothetical protein GY942_11170, partial [Aestuariibacter sp.]|nr:hypothetical protein [Aestuariibacter sp.]